MLIVLTLGVMSAQANFSVSPVIIEGTNIKKGNIFRVVCEQGTSEILDVQLSLALFDQDEAGNVYFLEDPSSVAKVQGFLDLKTEVLTLNPQTKSTVEIGILDDNFTSLYAVLFVKPKQLSIATRFAVLLLLSTQNLREQVQVSTWEKRAENLELTIVNNGSRHGLWQGELLLYDGQGNLSEKRSVQSGLVLAGRSREWGITLPSWVNRVELKNSERGVGR